MLFCFPWVRPVNYIIQFIWLCQKNNRKVIWMYPFHMTEHALQACGTLCWNVLLCDTNDWGWSHHMWWHWRRTASTGLWKGQKSCVCLRWQAARKTGLRGFGWSDSWLLACSDSAKSKWSRLAFSSGSYIGGSIKARRQLFILGAMHYHWRIVKEERDCQKRKEGFTINAAGSCLGELDFIPVYDMGYYFMLWNHLNRTFPTCL